LILKNLWSLSPRFLYRLPVLLGVMAFLFSGTLALPLSQALPSPRFILFDLGDFTSSASSHSPSTSEGSTSALNESNPPVPFVHPQKTLDYALTQSVMAQGSYAFPKTVGQLTYLMEDIEQHLSAKPPLLLLYGRTPPPLEHFTWTDGLLQQQWPVIWVWHPLAPLDYKVAWQEEFRMQTQRYRSKMQEQLGVSQSSVLDTALAGSTTTANPFPVLTLASGCQLYTLPYPFIQCETNPKGVKPLQFIRATPVLNPSSLAEAKSKSSPPPHHALSTSTVLPVTPALVEAPLKPNYDVLKVFYDLASQWNTPVVLKAIQERYAPFDLEARALEEEFNLLQSDVWQRMQAFDVLGKNVNRTQMAQDMTRLQDEMDALGDLRRHFLYKEFRQKSNDLMSQVMTIKQKLLFPNLPNHIHGVWFDRGSLVNLGNATALKTRLQALKKAGMTDIFIETINAGYAIYPDSHIQPIQNPLIQGWDPLAVAVEESHALGMRVHAWVWCFAVGNVRHNDLLGIDHNAKGPVLDQHPTQQLLMSDGTTLPKGQHEFWLSPASYEAQELLVDWYLEIIRRYNVDGLQLDYVRYPFQSTLQRAGYDAVSVAHFQDSTGLKISKDTQDAFDRWKTENISRFVGKTTKTLKAEKPELILSAAVFALPRHDRLKAIGQDWETWAQRGWIDWLMPMAYTENTATFNRQISSIKQSLKPTKTLLVSGVGLHKLEGAQRIERSEQLQDNGVSGWAWFANAHLDQNTLDLLALTTQKVPLGGTYTLSLAQNMNLYTTLLKKVFQHPSIEEAQMLDLWEELSHYLDKPVPPTLQEALLNKYWNPLQEETQRLLAQRFASVPALRQWLSSELERLDAQWRSQKGRMYTFHLAPFL
jgi:uncharacterized lipoprotein YddW (UPF0748 family)